MFSGQRFAILAMFVCNILLSSLFLVTNKRSKDLTEHSVSESAIMQERRKAPPQALVISLIALFLSVSISAPLYFLTGVRQGEESRRPSSSSYGGLWPSALVFFGPKYHLRSSYPPVLCRKHSTVKKPLKQNYLKKYEHTYLKK